MDKRTRVALSLPPEVLAVLDRLAAITGTGRATVLREWLLEGLPMFVQMADALEQAKAGQRDALELMANALQEAAGEVNQASLDLRENKRLGHRAARVKGGKS